MFSLSMTRVLAPAFVAALLASTGIAAAATTIEEAANLTGPDRQKVLEEGAKKEGEVTWYTSLIVDQVSRPIADAFQKKYPFVKVGLNRMETGDILQRVTAEARARSVRVDVIAGDVAAPLKAAGLAQAFTTPYADPYPKGNIDPDRMWISIRSSWQGIAWNTKMVPDADAPKTWEALLEPKWKGKIAWGAAADTGAPRLISHFRKVWGEEKTVEYLTRLAKQDVRTLPGSIRSVLDQVIAGEYAIGISMAMHHVAISQSLGAPINGTSPDPVLTRTGVISVVKNAPHPNAAMLFMDFLLDKDGGPKVLVAAQYNPTHPDVEPLPELRWIMPSKMGKSEVILTPTEEEGMTAKSMDLYKTIFR
jgi:iron(III) transport system substrate-binding protein